jgi:hypothetical protein
VKHVLTALIILLLSVSSAAAGAIEGNQIQVQGITIGGVVWSWHLGDTSEFGTQIGAFKDNQYSIYEIRIKLNASTSISEFQLDLRPDFERDLIQMTPVIKVILLTY